MFGKFSFVVFCHRHRHLQDKAKDCSEHKYSIHHILQKPLAPFQLMSFCSQVTVWNQAGEASWLYWQQSPPCVHRRLCWRSFQCFAADHLLSATTWEVASSLFGSNFCYFWWYQVFGCAKYGRRIFVCRSLNLEPWWIYTSFSSPSPKK